MSSHRAIPITADGGITWTCKVCGEPVRGANATNHTPPLPQAATEATATPYAGSSGHSGSETSKARAERNDTSGRSKERQSEVLRLAAQRGAQGITVKEVREGSGWHHGETSGALTRAHKTGLLARLTETRDRCALYVLPEYVNGRETEAQGRQSPVDVALREWLLGTDRAEQFPAQFIVAMRLAAGFASA